jgi:Ca2+-binding EF-hand superfamily protein
MKALLHEFEIDTSFAPAMMRILNGQRASGAVEFDQLRDFLTTLVSRNTHNFLKMLFEAIDIDKDGYLQKDDVVGFAKLMNDNMDEEDAKRIVRLCDNDGDGKLRFDEFWKWYRMEHGVVDGAASPSP